MTAASGTRVEVSPRVVMVLRALAPNAGGGVRWDYDVAVDGERIISETDLVTSAFGPDNASRVLAGVLLADLASQERVWPEEIRNRLTEIRSDLEGWGAAVLGR